MSTDSSVTFGDVSFDPVETQDFRLSVEGTSGTGKSNTLAVLLEDLANVAIPTLVIERLGALTPTRLEDEQVIVVGARDEEGIDLAVSRKDLDSIGSWVLDKGMKIILDISTYARYEDENSRVHRAAATALRSLNDRAHEKYRSGDRTKSLLVVDEAHILAPKDSAPEPELDEHVKQCRGQLIKASTEGGNKGISVIVGYQRRAFLHNGVIQLAQDFVAHRPGDEDIGRTADALRCDESVLAGLETGEIVARGPALTDNELVGPTNVRKRTSPDPREETFDLPEPPEEVSDVLDDLQGSVEAEREKRNRRQSRIEELEETVESLREDKRQLQEDLQNNDKIARALDRVHNSSNDESSDELTRKVETLEERKNELSERNEELEKKNRKLQQQLDELREDYENLQEQYEEDLSALNSLRTGFQMLQIEGDTATEITGPDEDQLRDIIRDEVQSMDIEGGDSKRSFEDVHDVLLDDFQEDAVQCILDSIQELSANQKRLLSYIEARNATINSQKAWAQNALNFSGNPNSTHYSSMNELIEAGYVSKNKDGSIAPNLRSHVADQLDGFDPSDEVVTETYKELLARIAETSLV